MAKEKTCFVIAPIGESESDTRKRSDQILKHIIKPAAKDCGYKALRADEISEPGIITSQVIQHIVEDPLVIADLTGSNPNVFYELAIRHAIKKPLVQIIRKGEAIPFDVAGTRTVHVDHHDLDSVEEAKTEIVKQIKTVEKDATKIDTPISVALDLQIMRQSDNPEQRSLADLVASISEIRTSMVSMEKRLDDPNNLLPVQYLDRLIKRMQPIPSADPSMIHRMRVCVTKLVKLSVPKSSTPANRDRVRMLLRELSSVIDYMECNETEF